MRRPLGFLVRRELLELRWCWLGGRKELNVAVPDAAEGPSRTNEVLQAMPEMQAP
jgi:hypothetical protein